MRNASRLSRIGTVRRELIKSAVILPLAFVLYLLWPLPWQLAGVIGSLAEAQVGDLVVWLVFPVVMAVISVATLRRRLSAPALRTRREQLEANLADASQRLRDMDDSVSSVQGEQEQHRGLVAPRE